MSQFLMRKSNLILCFFTTLFIVVYIVFSSLQTSLDFKINQINEKQAQAAETREEIVLELAQVQNFEHLKEQGAILNLIEAPLADGYIDLRLTDVEVGNNLAKTK